MAGRLVVSLDFELMWGVRDHRSAAQYGDAIMGGRQAIPQMLELFSARGIRATWATVGLLFARDRDEMRAYAPQIRPDYDEARLSPYPALDQIGQNESQDPLHFGRSLLDRIAQTEGQEIASHTYGHVYALEPGMTAQAWHADLSAAVAIAGQAGHRLRSIVFPRNQMSPEHVAICRDLGMSAYRGVPQGQVYRSRSGADLSLPIRVLRLVDGAVPLLGGQSFEPPRYRQGSIDIPASRFLRPWSPIYAALQQRRIIQEMTQAARTGKHYHLWWHPHNMGRNTGQNMAQLTAILDAFRPLRDAYDFQSASMADIATQEGAV